MKWLITAYSSGQTDVDPNLVSECLEAAGPWFHSHLKQGLEEEWACTPFKALIAFGEKNPTENDTFLFNLISEAEPVNGYYAMMLELDGKYFWYFGQVNENEQGLLMPGGFGFRLEINQEGTQIFSHVIEFYRGYWSNGVFRYG